MVPFSPHHNRNLQGGLGLALLLLVTLVACQSNGPTMFDQTIPPERQIPLAEGGPHKGQADASSAVVAYAYKQLTSSRPDVNLELKGQIISVDRNIDQVNIYLLALDGQGKSISRTVVFASGYRRSVYFRRSWRFEKFVSLPPETAAMAFHAYTRRSRGRK
jgi:hypothetical protein